MHVGAAEVTGGQGTRHVSRERVHVALAASAHEASRSDADSCAQDAKRLVALSLAMTKAHLVLAGPHFGDCTHRLGSASRVFERPHADRHGTEGGEVAGLGVESN